MNKRIRSLIDPNTGVYLAALCIFDMASIVLGFFRYGVESETGRVLMLLATVETVAIVLLVVYFLTTLHKKQKELAAYVESIAYEADSARTKTVMNFPLPSAVFELEGGRVIWGNELFFEACGASGLRLDTSITDLIPEFSVDWLLRGETEFPSLLEMNGRKYRIQGCRIFPEGKEKAESILAVIYGIDMTEADAIRREYEASRPVSATVVIDNYEELIKNRSDRERNNLRDSVEDKLSAWAGQYRSFIRRFDRDRYIAFFEERDLEKMTEDRFSLLQEMHGVVNPAGIEASLSIGIGREGETYAETLQFADLAAELALSRGGDQAVVKDAVNFEFFGGRGSEVEKRTKVKSRVMANTLRELIKDSSKVFVMGHKFADLDAIGSAVGVCVLARSCGVKANIIVDEKNNACSTLIEELKQEEDYRYVFLDADDADFHPDGHTLLVVVDTNRPEQVEIPELLDLCNRVAVIDHHRVGSTYIRNAALGFIEPYASSVCELLTEILQEVTEPNAIRRFEADALLAGIVLDTKGFALRTGERTFDAASYLRRLGADTANVKRLMQSGMEDTLAKYRVLETAKLYRNVAIAAADVPQSRVVAAKAADDLLGITGVEASVVLVPNEKGGIFASARSIGEMNVQILMEKLGGGGNRSAAAMQMPGVGMEEAMTALKQAIDAYWDNE